MSQEKAQQANDQALEGADKQRDLINKQKKVRARQKHMQDLQSQTEAQDRLGNFEIQRLMSQHNQSEQTSSSVQKKDDDSANATINRIK